MSALIGSGFGFLFPYLLIALPIGLGALVWAYLKRGKGIRVPVGTTFILSQIKSKSSSRKKFNPPLRFYIELLLLTLLVAAAGGIYRTSSEEATAVIIDNSLSMSSVSAVSGKSILEDAIERAKIKIEEIKSPKIEVFATTPALISLTNGIVPKSRAKTAVGDLPQGYSEDNIEANVTAVLRSENFSRVIVITDKEASFLGSYGSVTVETVGADSKPRDNISISSMLPVKERDGRERINVSLKSFARYNNRLKVNLHMLSNGEEKFIDSQEIDLNSRKVKTVSFLVKSGPPTAYTASIEVQGGLPDAIQNSITLDDKAWLSVNDSLGSILVVGEATPESLGLNRITAGRFSHVSYEEYLSNRVLYDRESEAIIFYRSSPDIMPDKNSMFILPSSSKLFDPRIVSSGKKITRWNASHPILTYAKIPLLKLSDSVSYNPPEWGEVVISTSNGAILLAGSKGGYRRVIFGFQIFPFEGKKSPVLSVITLNSLKWIAEGGFERGYWRVGESIKIKDSVLKIEYENGEPVYDKGSSTGRAIFTRPGVAIVHNEDGSQYPMGINLFNEEESNTLDTFKFTVKESVSPVVSTKDPLWRLFAIAVLLVLILEFAFNAGFKILGAKNTLSYRHEI